MFSTKEDELHQGEISDLEMPDVSDDSQSTHEPVLPADKASITTFAECEENAQQMADAVSRIEEAARQMARKAMGEAASKAEAASRPMGAARSSGEQGSKFAGCGVAFRQHRCPQ